MIASKHCLISLTFIITSYCTQEEIDSAVSQLLKLKKDYQNLTGEDLAGGGSRGKKEKKKKDAGNEQKDSKSSKKQEKAAQAAKGESDDVDSSGKKITRSVSYQ